MEDMKTRIDRNDVRLECKQAIKVQSIDAIF